MSFATALARAEDQRRAKDIPAEVRTSHDVAARRRSARALARIADAASIDGLLQHLADEDDEVVAWAAYGLGYACKGREDANVRALAARAASLAASAPKGELDPRLALARAIGRCAGKPSEDVLVGLAQRGGEWVTPALTGLGDLATRAHALGAVAMTTLLDAAAANDMAFYALTRAEPTETFKSRVGEASRAALAKSTPGRILAIRALGQTGKEGVPELVKVVSDGKTYNVGERAEAARALGKIGDGVSDALLQITPDGKDAVRIQQVVGPEFNVFYTLLNQVGADPPKKAEPVLQVLATLASSEPRAGWIRCTAALGLAKGAYDTEILKKCDAEGSEPWEKARLTALLRRPLAKDRLTAFRELLKTPHLRIHEDAIDGLASHAELGDAIGPMLVDGLGSKHAGLVAATAELIAQHPDLAMTLAESEKRAALDPKAPPPTANPAQEVMPMVGKALAAALAQKWPEDRFETRMALFEAAAKVKIAGAKEAAMTACGDPNGVVRERALKALHALGAEVKGCDAPKGEPPVAAEIGKTIAKPAKLHLEIGANRLTIVLEPELSPITATRILALAKSGFYKGIVVHRVVPGFVAQFGDPDGDGYGGSGTSLRCETSPVPFRNLDVGMALAGRDTGSSQMFVTLSRTPHLDGEYTRVGHAEGDWSLVAHGDVIREVTVEE
jgi:cyclophilin family peptidyl-prolyl cis-trans isomerase